MKQIAIISGKGGTGKTTVTSTLIYMLKELNRKFVIADCDVDAPNLWILTQPKIKTEKDFYGMPVSVIDQKECIKCGKCIQTCRFGAIIYKENTYSINEIECEGCRACNIICPVNAIKEKHIKRGKIYVGETAFAPMVYGRLIPGSENSGKLVYQVKTQAKTLAKLSKAELIIIDGPPGIACPVISTITGIDSAIVVTEATKSALSDLSKLYDLLKKMKIPAKTVINKSDLNDKVKFEIHDLTKRHNFKIVAEVPFSKDIVDKISERKIPYQLVTPYLKKLIEEVF